jgi:hypothetical protein
MGMANLIMFCVQKVFPTAAGYCILIQRRVFQAVHGFDEDLLLSEDHDLVRRAAHHGPFRVFRLPIRTSTRRYLKKGALEQLGQYARAGIMLFLGRRITRSGSKLEYEFGRWDGIPAAPQRGRASS